MRINQGEYKGKRIKTISGEGYRPATGKVRQAIFSMLEARGIDWSKVRVMDLFAGSGILGFEAMSLGAKEVWFVEQSGRAGKTIRENLKSLDIPRHCYQIISKDVFTFLKKKIDQPFQLIFIDPPYGKDFLQPVMERLVPPLWISRETFIIAEVESRLDINFRFSELELCINRTYGQTRVGLWTAKIKR